VRSRWLLAFAGDVRDRGAGLALVQSQGGDVGSQGFNRTTAGLINSACSSWPLLALVLGAGAIAGERDAARSRSLRAQPISAAELLLGKYAGLTIAVWMAIALGFGAAGVVMALVHPLTDIGTTRCSSCYRRASPAPCSASACSSRC